MTDSKLTSIQEYRRKPSFNIGIVVFGVILIYLVATILLYLTNRHVSVYEVREGTILKDTAYTGLALRSETIVRSDGDGYVNFFCQEGSKVGAKTDVLTISGQKLDFKEAGEEASQELSSEEQAQILLQEQAFSENFRDGHFQEVYTLKNNISTVLENKSSQSRQAQLSQMLESGGQALQVFKASGDGIILFSTDGYEKTTPDQVTEDMLSRVNYSVTDVQNNMKVSRGDPLYRLITEDTWSLVISLSDSAAKEMKDLSRIRVRFLKDNETERADFEIIRSKGKNFGVLTFEGAMIRYAQERFLDIELILEDESGLKIPKSAVVKKDFYTIPRDYLTQGGNSSQTGVLVDKGTDSAQFQAVDVYFNEEKTGLVYLDPLAFDEDTVLVKPESDDTLQLSAKKKLSGVFNINKGYAVFKQIEILCESDEYYIVKSGNDYSLANYDHIALDGSIVKENDIVF